MQKYVKPRLNCVIPKPLKGHRLVVVTQHNTAEHESCFETLPVRIFTVLSCFYLIISYQFCLVLRSRWCDEGS